MRHSVEAEIEAGTATSYYCRDCGEHINAKPNPVVVYLVAGPIGGGRELDAAALHPGIVDVLKQSVARRVWCADCAPAGLAALLATPTAAPPEVVPDPTPPAA